MHINKITFFKYYRDTLSYEKCQAVLSFIGWLIVLAFWSQYYSLEIIPVYHFDLYLSKYITGIPVPKNIQITYWGAN